MDTIKILGTDDTPSGRSLPEDVAAFYAPVLSWLGEYAGSPNAKTVFSFKLVYFNTASSKLLLDILMKLEEISEAGHEVLVKWYYPDDDEDMEEAGKEYAEIVGIPFEQVPYEVQ